MFESITFYDWVPFFKELSLKIAELGDNQPSRNDKLKEKALTVFGNQHPINEYNEIDPFSFVYALAQRTTKNQKYEIYNKVKETFSLQTKLPSDWVFPTPPPNALSLFYNQGGYTNDKNQIVGSSALWNLFADAARSNDFNDQDFETVLSIKRVGITKLTQALFLINPEQYLPIDGKFLWLPVLDIEINELKQQIEEHGASRYREILLIYQKAFPGCGFYEINLLCGLLADEDPPFLRLNDSFCQISSKVDGSDGADYYQEFVEANGVWPGSAGTHLGGGGYDLQNVNTGDIVLIRRGIRNLGGIAVIIDNEYKKSGYDPNKSIRIIWLNKESKKLDYGLGDWKGFTAKATDNTYESFYSQYANTLDLVDKIIAQQNNTELISRKHIFMGQSLTSGLNTILYGPPGTGKTYNTIEKAIRIINEKKAEDDKFIFPENPQSEEGRKLVKAEYDKLVTEGQVVFTTFHQSMSYEDFIEGIKPKTINNQVVYEIQDGILKDICNKARYISGNLVTVLEKFKTDISEEDGKQALAIKAQGTSFDIVYRGTNVFYVQPHNSIKENPWYPINIDNIRKAFETDNYTGIYNPTYVREVIAFLKKNYGLIKANQTDEEIQENYVLIIDEINRGNVSQIFGELITLIEGDKREGKDEELNIQLPYSKQQFSVPENLYIIGTMNTADRSVEALDTALRRRFSFEFIPPKPEILTTTIAGIELKQLLNEINERIAYLLDQDHQIGHSYFMRITDEAGLRRVFKNKIVPLLREYFYNDFGKIRLVLGDGFVEKKTNYLPKFAVSENSELNRDIFVIKDIDENFDIASALKQTLGRE